jgi:indoleamine 2,3-dioxygenase
MSATLDESFFADSLALPRVASNLIQIASIIDQLTSLLSSAVKGTFGASTSATIVPEVFYWQIRPWFNGGKWVYEGIGHWDDVEMEWLGPSAGQSSLIHAIDLFLGVDHSPRPSSTPPTSPLTAHQQFVDPTRPKTPATSTSTEQQALRSKRPSTDDTYMLRATQYMPCYHRAFLLHLSSLSVLSHMNLHPLPSIRSLAQSSNSILAPAYDQAIMAMKLFRDEHMKIATRFIVTQARSEPGVNSVFWPQWETKRILKEEEKRIKELQQKLHLQVVERHTGTGGTELVTFLKDCRARTVEAFLGSSA